MSWIAENDRTHEVQRRLRMKINMFTVLILILVSLSRKTQSSFLIPAPTESISTCRIGILPEGCFCTPQYLRRPMSIVCRDLGLTSFRSFQNLQRHHVNTLDLSGNAFEEIPRHAFGRLSVKHLILSGNTMTLKSIDPEAFHPRQRRSLRSLDLSQNHLLAIPECIRNLTRLERLNLHGNDITSLGRRSLQGLFNLTDLSIGALSSISRDSFQDVHHLNHLTIAPKALYVDDGLAWLYFNLRNIDELKNLQTLVINSGVITFDGRFLGAMESLRHLEISRSALDSEQLDLCRIMDPQGRMQHVSFGENRLKRIPKSFLITLTGLEYLDLHDNLIRRVTRNQFRNNRALRYLDLSHNRIGSLDSNALASLDNLQVLNLRSNYLHRVSQTNFPRHMAELFLAHNLWSCNCDMIWLMQLSLRQHLGHVTPLDVFEVETELKCRSPITGVTTLLHEACDLLLSQDSCLWPENFTCRP